MLEMYDSGGQPLTDQRRFAAMIGDPNYKTVGHTELEIDSEGGYVSIAVSTVWLGFDHRTSLSKSDKPLIFETMIFGGYFDSYQWRYTTWARAKIGHEMIVFLLEGGLTPYLDTELHDG